MDSWEAPQWADFNATVTSDVEDFFRTEHETHERKRNSDSFEESMDSRSSVSSVADDAPRSDCSSPMPKSNSSRSTAKSNFSIPTPKSNSSSPMPKGNFSIPIPKINSSSPMSKSNFSIPIPKSNFSSPMPKTMGNFSTPMAKSSISSPMAKKMGNFSSPIPSRVSRGSGVRKGGEIFSSAIDLLRSNTEKKIRSRSLAAREGVDGFAQSAAEASLDRREKDNGEEIEKKIEENSVYRDNGEEETGENNRTLVADEDEVESQDPVVSTEKNEKLDRAEEKLAIRHGEENSEVVKLDSNCEISESEEAKTDDKISDEAKTKLEESEIRLDPSKRLVVETKESEENLPISQLKADSEISTVPEDKPEDKFSEEDCPALEKKEENLPISRSDEDPVMIALSENKSEDKISAAEKSKLVKPVSQLDPPKLPIPENKSEDKISGEEKSKLVKLVSQLDPPKRSIPENKSADKISGDEKLKLAKLVSQLDPQKRPIPENKSADKISGEEKLKLAKLVSQLDPPKRPIPEKRAGGKISGEEKLKLAKLVPQLDPPNRPVLDRKNPPSRAPAKSRVLTSQVRRYSISKYRRRSNQYVSLAEAVSKFQTGTPKRFRSTNRKDDKAGPVQKTKQTAVKLTCPMSPALLCKFRSRAVSVPNAEQREQLEIEEIRKNRVRPNPIKTSATNIRRPAKGPRTQSESSVGKNSRALPQSTKTIVNRQASTEKKTTVDPKVLPKPTASSSELKSAMDPPKGPTRIVKKPSGLPSSTDHTSSIKATLTKLPKPPTHIDKKFVAPDDFTVAPERKKETHLMSTSISKHTPRKKMVPALVSTEDDLVIKNVEILHFGIPINTDYKNKNITRTIPFSFDTRNKESQSKKEKLKTQQVEEDKSRKSTFHARPAPAFVKAAPTARVPATPKEKDNNPNKPMLCPLSFQERNELLLQKKKKMIEDAVEKEKKARVFHAKPAPALKPVFVRGASAENLRASSNAVADSDKRKSRGLSPAGRQRGLSQDSVVSNQENKAPNLPHQPAVMQCPKLKNPLMGQNLVIKKTTGGK